ncbi:glycoside hydrolase family 15 protein [Streptomyces sp. CC208A]|uniref:glycoside hydrolase family 15 protein n=1 Tax=Streptomyces sp. CC208A TaxID=3044573 RepID=UPI0024A824C5|nr:glycoside hydrolase family 15 protein [Streptomyces sp. CC208A]
MASAIEDYAVIGDLHTAALVGRDGSVDWLCLPRFDSPACFAALLHDETAGRWLLAPADGGSCTTRRYRGESLVLESEWRSAGGTVRVVDFMPPRGEAPDVVRIVEGVEGRVRMAMELRLRFDYGGVTPMRTRSDGGLRAVAGPDSARLWTPVDLRTTPEAVEAGFEVEAGRSVPFVLTYQASHLEPPEHADPAKALEETEDFWSEWIAACDYDGRRPEAVRRALITLKALTYAPTGGVLAAATASLPEWPGGERNWDYRYCWLRDSTFTLQALLTTGYLDEARAWREWLVRAAAGEPTRLRAVYTLDGGRRLPDLEPDWLAGYGGASPVRIGNGSSDQFQLDVLGEVLDCLHLARNSGLTTDETVWDLQKALLDHLEGNWREPDRGIWEVRGPPRDFVHSKVMAWTGFDRAVRTVRHHGLPGPAGHWASVRDEIHREVCSRGYDAERNTFTRSYGSRELDAALLLLPRVGFLPWTDPRVRGTVDAVRRELSEDGLLLRYRLDTGDGDGLPGREGAFVACAFWLVDALHSTGRRREAEELFERLLSLRNDVGLLSEEYDTSAGRFLGNVPQAFSMVGLINSARLLSGERTETSHRRREHGGGAG